MPGPRAAEGEQRQAAWVLAALDGMHTRRARHPFIYQLMDAPRRAKRRHAERLSNPAGDRSFGSGTVEPQAAAEEELRIEIAEQQIGVGHGRLSPATAVAHRAGIGARAVRTNFQQAEAV